MTTDKKLTEKEIIEAVAKIGQPRRAPKQVVLPDDVMKNETDGQPELFYNPKAMTRGQVKAALTKAQQRRQRRQRAVAQATEEKYEVLSEQQARIEKLADTAMKRPKRKYDDDH